MLIVMLMIRNIYSRVIVIKIVICIWLFLFLVGFVFVVSKIVILDILVGKELFLKIKKCVYLNFFIFYKKYF